MLEFLKNLNTEVFKTPLKNNELEIFELKLNYKLNETLYNFIKNYNGFTYKSIEFLELNSSADISIVKSTTEIQKLLNNSCYIVIEYLGDGLFTLFNNINGKIYSLEKDNLIIKEIASNLELYIKERLIDA